MRNTIKCRDYPLHILDYFSKTISVSKDKNIFWLFLHIVKLLSKIPKKATSLSCFILMLIFPPKYHLFFWEILSQILTPYAFDETYQIILHVKVIRSVVGWGYYVSEMEVSMTISCRIVSEMMAMPNK